jgi:hypothetical protein
MADFPDLYCWIKLIDKSTGKLYPEGWFVNSDAVIVRYVVANDSHQSAESLWVIGTLSKNGSLVRPPGKRNVVPEQQITVKPGRIWKAEYEVNADWGVGVPLNIFKAALLVDIVNTINEEDENNNQANASFWLS